MVVIYSLQFLTKRISFLTFIILSLFIVSCDKESPEPEAPVEEGGFIKAHFATIADLRIEKTTASSFGYDEAPTARGFIFKPLKDIKMTSVGALIAEKGTYKISLTKDTAIGLMNTGQVLDSLVVTDTEKFTYKKLQNPVVLKADSIYTISYFTLSHSAVYDAVSAENQIPFTTADIEIQYNHFAYFYFYPPSKKYLPYRSGWFAGKNMMRGVVDFIYEEI